MYFHNHTGYILASGSADRLNRTLSILRELHGQDTILPIDVHATHGSSPIVTVQVRINRDGLVILA